MRTPGGDHTPLGTVALRFRRSMFGHASWSASRPEARTSPRGTSGAGPLMGPGERIWETAVPLTRHNRANATEISVAFTYTMTGVPTSAGPDTHSPGKRSADPLVARSALGSASTITT